jgi:hypothetical protein
MSLATPQPQGPPIPRQQSNKSCKTILLVLVAVATSLTAALLWPHEPAYLGRSLSSWLRDLDPNSVETQVKAAEAVRHIGPKGVPFIIRRLGSPKPSRIEELVHGWASWISARTGIRLAVTKHYDERMEALAALDALRENAADAIPALQRLMAESPPDPRALYVVARTGKAGLPVVRGAVTDQEKILRLESKVCLEMIETHSGVLYADIELGPEAATFQQRICLFNAETLRAAFREYRDRHPNE